MKLRAPFHLAKKKLHTEEDNLCHLVVDLIIRAVILGFSCGGVFKIDRSPVFANSSSSSSGPDADFRLVEYASVLPLDSLGGESLECEMDSDAVGDGAGGCGAKGAGCGECVVDE